MTSLQPVTLSINCDAALAAGGRSLAVAGKEAGGFVALAGSTCADGAAGAPLMHFSQ